MTFLVLEEAERGRAAGLLLLGEALSNPWWRRRGRDFPSESDRANKRPADAYLWDRMADAGVFSWSSP